MLSYLPGRNLHLVLAFSVSLLVPLFACGSPEFGKCEIGGSFLSRHFNEDLTKELCWELEELYQKVENLVEQNNASEVSPSCEVKAIEISLKQFEAFDLRPRALQRSDHFYRYVVSLRKRCPEVEIQVSDSLPKEQVQLRRLLGATLVFTKN